MANKSYKVGAIHPTKNHGDIEIIQRIDKLKRVVRFLLTGNEKITSTTCISRGYVCDPGSEWAKSKPARLQEGDVFTTLKSGEAEIITYLNSRNIYIRFKDTGNVKKVKAERLEAGNVMDKGDTLE